jgi:hypothetical protein
MPSSIGIFAIRMTKMGFKVKEEIVTFGLLFTVKMDRKHGMVCDWLIGGGSGQQKIVMANDILYSDVPK